MIFSWWKRRRRRNIQAEPFPPSWEAFLERNFAHWQLLDDDERARLKKLIQVFVAEKYWEGCNGLELNDEIKVTIAAQACLLLLNLNHDFYRMLQTILVYPTGYFAPTRSALGRMAVESTSPVLGQAHYQGPVILSWQHALEGGRRGRSGRNLVYHEFAHKLDMKDGVVDGTPILASRAQHQEWVRVMTEEFESLRRDLGRKPTLLREYGATNPGEFFAVATEIFFERSLEMRAQHPDLYRVLREYYQQDPTARMERAGWSP